MRTHLPLARPAGGSAARESAGLRRRRDAFHLTKERRQVVLDLLAVIAVIILILVTITALGFYVAHELPHWRAGQFSGFETLAPPATQGSDPSPAVSSAPQARFLSPVPLMLISIAIEAAIFIGLGLYLRREMDRMP